VVGLLSTIASCSAPVCWLSHMKQLTIVHCPLSEGVFHGVAEGIVSKGCQHWWKFISTSRNYEKSIFLLNN